MSNFVWYLPVVLRIYFDQLESSLLENLTRMLDLMKYGNVDTITSLGFKDVFRWKKTSNVTSLNSIIFYILGHFL